MLVVVALGAYLYHHRPNLYDRGRRDLLETNRQLEIYHKDMEVLMQEEQGSAEALRGTIISLQEAASLDQNDVAEIESITAELLRWEQQSPDGGASPSGKFTHDYQVLVERVDRLIKKHIRAAAG